MSSRTLSLNLTKYFFVFQLTGVLMLVESMLCELRLLKVKVGPTRYQQDISHEVRNVFAEHYLSVLKYMGVKTPYFMHTEKKCSCCQNEWIAVPQKLHTNGSIHATFAELAQLQAKKSSFLLTNLISWHPWAHHYTGSSWIHILSSCFILCKIKILL